MPFLMGRPVLFLTMVLIILISVYTPNAMAKPAPYDLTPKQIREFRRDGVIVVKGMLEGELLEDAVKAAQKIQRTTPLTQRILYKIYPSYRNLCFQTYRRNKALKKVAFDSVAPTICAKLMGLVEEQRDERGNNNNEKKPRAMRLLKDAVMGYSRGDVGCDWHVDDKHFWPCEDTHNDEEVLDMRAKPTAFRRDAGINVWISLSPVTAKEGGGLAVAPGTHYPSCRGMIGRLIREGRRAIGAGGSKTCLLAMLEPDSHAHMERIKKVYDLQPGDAIVHDRYLFHKTDEFKDVGGDNDDRGNDTEGATKQRISLRYMPSDATYFRKETSFDAAAAQKDLETGDPIWKAGEYFPQAWPCELEEELNKYTKLDENFAGAKTLAAFVSSVIKRKAGWK